MILWSQIHIASGLSSILNATTPLFAVIVGHLFLPDEPSTVRKVAGVIVGLAGVAAIVGYDGGGSSIHGVAEVAVLAAAICYALACAYGRRFRDMPPIVTAAGQVTGSAVFVLPVSLVVDQPWRLASPGLGAWGGVIALALLSTALAHCLYFVILKAAGATNLMLVTFLVPVSAILLGVLILGESLTAPDLAGLGAIATGLSLIDGRVWRLRFRGSSRP